MDDRAFEALHPLPAWRVAPLVAVIALAHPQETGGEADLLARVGPRRLDRPMVLKAGPAGRVDSMAEAQMLAQIILFDHLAHVLQDLRG